MISFCTIKQPTPLVCVTLILVCYLKLYLRLKWRVSPNICWIWYPISNKQYLALVFYQKRYIIIFDLKIWINVWTIHVRTEELSHRRTGVSRVRVPMDGQGYAVMKVYIYFSSLCKMKYLALVFLFISSS